MSRDMDNRRGAYAGPSERTQLRVSGGLMVAGLVVNAVFTIFHPAGAEDTHKVIFSKYAQSGSWVAVHLGQFVGVSLALGGLLVLYRAMRSSEQPPVLPYLAAAAAIATTGTWAVLQGLDGVGLKQAVVAWDAASGVEKATRFANAETVRWLEWGIQSYFRVLLGLTFVLFGAAILAGGLIAAWLGWVAVVAGVLSAAIGVDVGYSGLASPLQDLLSIIFPIVAFVFAVGVFVLGFRGDGQRAARR